MEIFTLSFVALLITVAIILADELKTMLIS